jgi:hypothetical protein
VAGLLLSHPLKRIIGRVSLTGNAWDQKYFGLLVLEYLHILNEIFGGGDPSLTMKFTYGPFTLYTHIG